MQTRFRILGAFPSFFSQDPALTKQNLPPKDGLLGFSCYNHNISECPFGLGMQVLDLDLSVSPRTQDESISIFFRQNHLLGPDFLKSSDVILMGDLEEAESL
jgi:hypothetical protein